MLKIAPMFKDHAVLQRKKKIRIWGTCTPWKEVTVSLQDQSCSALADESGKWQMECGPFETSFEETMIISCEGERLILHDILIGEVWLAGGQSNMEFHMRHDADLEEAEKECPNDNIRFFHYPEVSYPDQINDADYTKHYLFWRKADPGQLERFSAVAYYFARALEKRYQIPIGIIGCNWGGTPACAWMDRESILEGGGEIFIKEYEEAVKDLDLAAYRQKVRQDPGFFRTDLFADPVYDAMMYDGRPEALASLFSKMGFDPSDTDMAAFAPVIGPEYERRPSCLYESMLTKIAPYAIRGVIWYQGETDGDTHPQIYRTLFPALIRNWRRLWNDPFPFLFVQIAPLESWLTCDGTPYAIIRAAQQETADTVENTGMAVITDAGMRFDIHPKKKKPAGERLALLAQKIAYGEDVHCEAPALVRAEVNEGKLILHFSHTAKGLHIKENGEDPFIGGLRIFADDIEMDHDLLNGHAEGSCLIITGSSIHKDQRYRIELAETGWYQVNLYNSADLPARPSHTETEI